MEFKKKCDFHHSFIHNSHIVYIISKLKNSIPQLFTLMIDLHVFCNHNCATMWYSTINLRFMLNGDDIMIWWMNCSDVVYFFVSFSLSLFCYFFSLSLFSFELEFNIFYEDWDRHNFLLSSLTAKIVFVKIKIQNCHDI